MNRNVPDWWRKGATWLWRATIASKELSVAPSVIASIKPVSSLGKKPFGITM